jgi:hypothetical protein
MYYAFRELEDFVNSQPDEKEIAMGENFGDGCGCILIQFGRKYAFLKGSQCDFHTIYSENKILKPIFFDKGKVYDFINDCILERVTNFGEAKEILKSQTK